MYVKSYIQLVVLTLIGKSWKTDTEIFLKFSFSGSSHRPFYWKTHPDNFSNLFFFNLFKLRQKKALFLEEKQVNDETSNG